MKFHLEASFRLSADADKAEAAISDFFKNAGPILQKGAPEGQGARISAWKLDGSKIDLVIDSDRYVRAHDALLRLRRPLSERSIEIGQKIGLVLMLMLMACSFYNDLNRLISG